MLFLQSGNDLCKLQCPRKDIYTIFKLIIWAWITHAAHRLFYMSEEIMQYVYISYRDMISIYLCFVSSLDIGMAQVIDTPTS